MRIGAEEALFMIVLVLPLYVIILFDRWRARPRTRPSSRLNRPLDDLPEVAASKLTFIPDDDEYLAAQESKWRNTRGADCHLVDTFSLENDERLAAAEDLYRLRRDA